MSPIGTGGASTALQEAAGDAIRGRGVPSPRRLGRRPVVFIVAALLVSAGLFIAVRVGQPSDFSAIAPAVRMEDGVQVVPLGARPEGLRDGDVVVGVNGNRLAASTLPRPHVGDRLTYQVRRGDRLVDVEVTVGHYPLGDALAGNWATLVLLSAFLMVAGYVFARRPDDAAAQVLLVLSALITCAATSWVFSLGVVDLAGGPGWLVNLAARVVYVLMLASMVHFALVFPEPPALLQRRPQLIGLVYLAPLLTCVINVSVALAGPTTALRRIGVVAWSLKGAEYVVPILVVFSLTGAYRRAEAADRKRLRSVMAWIGAAAVGDLALWSLPTSLVGHALVSYAFHPLVLLPVPLAFATAVLRRSLFDIDVVIRRSLVFASLTACVVAIYVLTVGTLSRLFRHEHGWFPLVATGLVAVVVSPLQRRLRQGVAHFVYGYRDDPFMIIARLGQRLEELSSPDGVLPLVVETLATTLRLPYAAIELSYPGGVEQAARYGDLRGTPVSLPLVFRGESLGRLVVGERSAGETFSKRESRLLGDLARQAAVAAHAVRLTRDLQRSRERMVTAVEEERRRLRRELHDGVAPTLAAAALELQAVRRLTASDPAAADALAGRVAEDLKTVVAEVRHVVYDLRPAALDQLGLISALQERALSLSPPDAHAAMAVTLAAEGDFSHLPAAVEVAAFRIVCEALHNASRHSGAASCSVSLRLDVALELEVRDDGRGLSDGHPLGVGLASMRERAAELGGLCTIETADGGGTIVRAYLPLEPG